MALPMNDINILIVDDFPTMRKIVRQVLRQLGFVNVYEAEDGEGALELLRTNPEIQFVISDWNMPKMNGIELLRAVRSDDTIRKIPFLMVTAEADKDCIVEAVKSGVNGYIVKPFNAATLKDKMEKIFANRRA
jgi:two-component system chemotaxis response regulator CheY